MKRSLLTITSINKKRRVLGSRLCFLCFLSFLYFFVGVGLGEEKFPNRPITLIVGYGAGGTTDISARLLASAASKILGQPVVVVNKPGGGSSVAIAGLKGEKPDGYTIAVLPTGGILSQHFQKVPYDSAKDFTPIMQYSGYLYGLVVRADSPWGTFQDFVDYAKKNPGKIRYSTAGASSPPHLAMAKIALQQGIKWTHIPYNSGPEGMSALLGNHVEAFAQTAGDWAKQVEAGTFRPLCVFSEKRVSTFPNVPTLVELGYDIVPPSINCLIGPKGMSPQIVETLRAAFKKAMDDPEWIAACHKLFHPIEYRGPKELSDHLLKMNEEVETLVKKLGLRKD
jgi:tripartite-type tricarboxylate transporter receptor subunit TctC